MSSDPGVSVMLQVVRRGHACGEAGARVCCSSFSVCFFSFQTFGGSAQMLGENKEISAGR